MVALYNEKNFVDYCLCLTRASSTYKEIILYDNLNDKRGEQIILDKDKLPITFLLIYILIKEPNYA